MGTDCSGFRSESKIATQLQFRLMSSISESARTSAPSHIASPELFGTTSAIVSPSIAPHKPNVAIPAAPRSLTTTLLSSRSSTLPPSTSSRNNPSNQRKVDRSTNITKRSKKMKNTTFFTLNDSSYHLLLRNRLLDKNKHVVVSFPSIKRTAVNHFESIKYKNR